jgi:hypothetical protein
MTCSYIEWVSGDRNNQAQWNTTQTSATVYHQVQRQTPAPMQEINDMAEDGTAYYSMATVRNLIHFESYLSERERLFRRYPA